MQDMAARSGTLLDAPKCFYFPLCCCCCCYCHAERDACCIFDGEGAVARARHGQLVRMDYAEHARCGSVLFFPDDRRLRCWCYHACRGLVQSRERYLYVSLQLVRVERMKREGYDGSLGDLSGCLGVLLVAVVCSRCPSCIATGSLCDCVFLHRLHLHQDS
jgi:hypothetical protein